MKYNSLQFWILVLYVMLIFGFTSIPGNSFQHLTFLSVHDKFVHFGEYMVFGFLFFNALKPQYKNKKGFIISVLFLIFVPVIDENLQRLIPGRFPDYLDGIADIAGGLFGVFIRSRK